ncbi:MAG: ZIP family metal transporter [Patescibacteria group bacterium]
MITIYALLSVFLVSLISFIGALAISINAERLKKILLYLVSFSAGALFGDVFIHLLPEIARERGLGRMASFYILLGIIFLFIVEKIIHWRHCHHGDCEEGHLHPFVLTNLFGDSIHNFIDGLIIGASYLISIPIGIATTLAVILHEIPQEIGDFGVLLHGGFTKAKALLVNFATALLAVAGAIVALALNSYTENLTFFLIPFAAGNFIYIAGSDLIPELHKEKIQTSQSLLQLLAFMAGIGIMMFLLIFG